MLINFIQKYTDASPSGLESAPSVGKKHWSLALRAVLRYGGAGKRRITTSVRWPVGKEGTEEPVVPEVGATNPPVSGPPPILCRLSTAWVCLSYDARGGLRYSVEGLS